MRTTKPISTISFNTEPFLAGQLEALRKAGKLSFWAYIQHQPEDDEGGGKVHYHVYVEPSVLLQTDDLRNTMAEYDPTNPKPLGCLKFVSSQFADWFLYALHDEAYLASKGQVRKYHYHETEIIASDFDDLNFMIKSINRLSISPYQAMKDAMEHGVTFEEYFSRGLIPIPQLQFFERAWYLLLGAKNNPHTDRNGREGHPNEMPSDDGDLEF